MSVARESTSPAATNQSAEVLPRANGLMSSPAMPGPTAETTAQVGTAATARRKSEREVEGVARRVSTTAVNTAATKGATASQAFVTPKAVRTVCSSLPSISQSAQVPVPCLPISG